MGHHPSHPCPPTPSQPVWSPVPIPKHQEGRDKASVLPAHSQKHQHCTYKKTLSWNTAGAGAKTFNSRHSHAMSAHRSRCSVTKPCTTLCDPMDCSTPGSLSFTISQSLLQLMSTESVMPSNHLILCHPLLFLPQSFPILGPTPENSDSMGLSVAQPRVMYFFKSSRMFTMGIQIWEQLSP